MHRQGGEDAVPNLNGPGKTGSVDEIPGTQPGTRHAAELVNAFQEEICGVIESAGQSVKANAGDDRGASWGQLWDAITNRAIIGTLAITNLAVTSAKLAANAVSEAKIVNAAVSRVKLADDAKIFITTTEYTNISTIGGGGAAGVVTEFNRNVTAGEWYRVTLTYTAATGGANMTMLNGQGTATPGQTAPAIKGGFTEALSLGYASTSATFKSIDGKFSVITASSQTLAKASLSLETVISRDDSPG